ncbi:MAG: MMPL family transporter [Candidatus Latescibacteria bacterium]|jgi:uncharacterized protein|nr:MMPL family transporter [Candidatus Latescibacterota bacterium]
MKQETHSKVDDLLTRYVTFLCRHPWKIVISALSLTCIAFHFTTQLSIKSDFAELLPEGYRSVQDLHRLTDRIGGIGNLTVVIETENLKAGQRFADDLAEALPAQLPDDYIRFVEYKLDEERDFYEKNQYLYAELEDLEEVYDRLRRQIQRKKFDVNPLFVSEADLGLEDDTEDEEPFDLSDIEEKYEGKADEKLKKWTDNYFVGNDEHGQFLVMRLKPFGTSTGISFSEDLCNRVQGIIDGLDPESYSADMKVGLTGKYRLVLDEYASVREEMASTAIFTVLLVFAAIYIYFRTWIPVVNISIAIGVGILWTFCITYFRIGYLNTQTAFLGAIIVGNGINYGLILMARFKEEKALGRNAFDGTMIAFKNTITATVTSSVSTGIAYGMLMITDFKGFNQFGFIGGLGMLLCWMATFSILPALLVLWDRTEYGQKSWTRRENTGRLFTPIASLVSRIPTRMVGISATLVAVSVVLLIWWIPNSFEYDFSKLRNEPREESEARLLNGRVNRLFGVSQTPAVILVDDLEQVRPIKERVDEKRAAEAELPNPTIDRVRTIYDVLPTEQDDKIEILGDIKRLLDLNPPDLLGIKPEQVSKVNKFRENIILDEVTVGDVPGQLKRAFEEKDGTVGRLIFVYPRPDAGLWNGRNLIRFASAIRSNELPSGEVIYSSGDAVIFSDMLTAVAKDGPIATVGSFLGVILLLLIAFRSIRASVVILASLMGGMFMMVGVMVILDIKVNFFNFIVIPTTLGIGVDYSVNLYQRYRLDGQGSVANMIKHTGGALALCSSTTLIGYTSLMLTSNRALQSFGIMANIGEITTLLTALFALPAYLIIMERRSKNTASTTST